MPKIDLNTLNNKQADEIAEQIGQKLMLMLDQACDKMNEIVGLHNMKACIDYTTFALNDVPKNLKEDLFVNPKCLKSLNNKDLGNLKFILMDVSNRCKSLCKDYQVYPAVSYHIVEMPENIQKQ